MLVIRELEEMIVKLRSGAYEPIRDFNYRGPTHVSVGQEGTAAGACCALQLADNITSTHRGHGESLAKGTVAIRQMTDDQLRKRVSRTATPRRREDLIEAALEEHVYRTICELFGKDDGYCRGRGGSMHIADFSVGHLGANAIVGGGVPIATGAALANRYLRPRQRRLLLCRRRRLRQRRRAGIARTSPRNPSSSIISPADTRTACRSFSWSATTTTE